MTVMGHLMILRYLDHIPIFYYICGRCDRGRVEKVTLSTSKIPVRMSEHPPLCFVCYDDLRRTRIVG